MLLCCLFCGNALLQTVISDDQAKLGTFQDPAPRWVGNIIAWILNLVGPKGLEFAKYSIDYHYIRNWLYVNRCGESAGLTSKARVCCGHGVLLSVMLGSVTHAPRWVGNIIAWILNLVGPKGLEFAKYSIDYHYIRNWLYVNRWGGCWFRVQGFKKGFIVGQRFVDGQAALT
jgi:hypothetical protein